MRHSEYLTALSPGCAELWTKQNMNTKLPHIFVCLCLLYFCVFKVPAHSQRHFHLQSSAWLSFGGAMLGITLGHQTCSINENRLRPQQTFSLAIGGKAQVSHIVSREAITVRHYMSGPWNWGSWMELRGNLLVDLTRQILFNIHRE